MNKLRLYIIASVLLIISSQLQAQTPLVENVRFEQRLDGSLLVDIWYDVTSVSDLPLEIIIEASDDGGTTWYLPITSLTGDVGENISAGTDKHIVWDFYMDNPDTIGTNYQIRVTAHCMVCGQTITEDFTLTKNLDCPPVSEYSIKIGAPNVTLDLGGYTISGDVAHKLDYGIDAKNVNGIRIRNGIVENCLWGIHLIKTDNAIIENVIVRNLEIEDPNITVHGILITEGLNDTIRDSQFELLPAVHKGALVFANSDVTVSNVEVKGGFEAILFGGNSTQGFRSNSGSVINSRFIGIPDAAITIYLSDNVRIENNTFSECEYGLSIEPEYFGGIRKLYIENNDFSDCIVGMRLYGITESIISNNIIKNSSYKGSKGIALLPNMWCNSNEPDTSCFFSTANIIKDNIVSGNIYDMFHHELCIGNTWQGNSCETSQGSEIQDCSPIVMTAKEAFPMVDSAAKQIASEAQLIFLTSWTCDTTGKSYQWLYIYKSESQQKNFELRFINGRVVEQDTVTVPWMINDGNLPITESWIDSDSAIVITENIGGRSFRDSFELKAIEMNLAQTHWLFWNIFYIAQDTTFTINIDALK